MAMHYEITTTVQKAKVNGDITENKSALTQEELRQTREKTYAYSSPFLRCAVWLTIMTLLMLHNARFASMTFTSPYRWRVPSAEVCVITGPMCCPKGRHTCVMLSHRQQCTSTLSTVTSNDWSSRCALVLCYLNAPVHWVQLHPMTDPPGVHVCCAATSMHQYTEYSYIQWLILQVCMCVVLLPQCTSTLSTVTSNDWSSRCARVLCYLNAPVHWVQLHPMTDHPGVHVCCAATSMHQYTEYSYIQWLIFQVCMCVVLLPQCQHRQINQLPESTGPRNLALVIESTSDDYKE